MAGIARVEFLRSLARIGVPAILRANACPNMVLEARVGRHLGGC